MKTTPLSEQPKIVLFGLRNAGKSSLINNLLNKEVAIVSDLPGTTTDPVTRSIELGALGPCAVTDVPGFDDEGKTGDMRSKKAWKVLETADIIVFVTPSYKAFLEEEKVFLEKYKNRNLICVLSHADKPSEKSKMEFLNAYKKISVDNLKGQGVKELKNMLISMAPNITFEITPVQGLVREHDLVILVTPIDLAAPKGRLILPQVETIRDLLDHDCAVMIMKERELYYFYENTKIKPKLVITDSQVFSKVAADIPTNQLMTSFSILFARKKGDLRQFVYGLRRLSELKAGDSILIMEACAHHNQADDIGRVKIPRLFRQMVNPDVEFHFARQLPDNLQDYSLVISCGACMVTRNTLMRRLDVFKELNIAVINYGLFLAWANGLLPRALEPFEEEYRYFIENYGASLA
ncbi:MAG: [FeFe] hydrogenase H-cluster maturation GTPase HydF [Spirochaetales bacterium]|nr:[FeFe] hydrogenase H-cluster maturation GTPase HydF [Spirochaetales bacterium]